MRNQRDIVSRSARVCDRENLRRPAGRTRCQRCSFRQSRERADDCVCAVIVDDRESRARRKTVPGVERFRSGSAETEMVPVTFNDVKFVTLVSVTDNSKWVSAECCRCSMHPVSGNPCRFELREWSVRSDRSDGRAGIEGTERICVPGSPVPIAALKKQRREVERERRCGRVDGLQQFDPTRSSR